MTEIPEPSAFSLLPKSASSRFLLLVGFASLTLYLTWPGRCFVGTFNDDAAYVLAAKSLAKGSYTDLSGLDPTPFKRFNPGYPLFLLPVVALIGPHWNLLPGVSALLMVLSCIALWRLGSIFLNPTACALLCVAFAFHPLTVSLSSAVMSDPLFLALVLLYFVQLYRLGTSTSKTAWVLQGILLGWVMLVRQVGILLILPTVIAQAPPHRLRRLCLILVPALLVWSPFPLWTYHTTGTPTEYFGYWLDEIPILKEHLFDHIHRVLYFIFSLHLLGIRMPNRGIFAWLSGIPILCGMGFCWGGFRAALKAHPAIERFIWALGSFLLSCILVQLAWLSIDARYFLPLLPFTLLFLVSGGQALNRRLHPRERGMLIGVGLLWMTLLIGPTLLTFVQRQSDGPSLPTQTLEWIRQNIPPTDRILGIQPLLYLYTGRRGKTMIWASDREDFRYQLQKSRIHYIILIPFNANMPLSKIQNNPNYSMMSNRRWITEGKTIFPEIYRNPEEKAQIYRVMPDPRFEEAYDLYQSGVQDLQSHRFYSASLKLNKSISRYPDLMSAWTALGILDYANHHFLAAEIKLRRVLDTEPDDILATFHLARIYAARHRWDLAQNYYSRAARAVEMSGRYEDILPDLQRESGIVSAEAAASRNAATQ